MEIRVVGRGALAGLLAGVLGFVFTLLLAEPLIERAIDYESGRDEALNALARATGGVAGSEGPEIVSRSLQSTAGLATGVIGFSVAMGALVAVAYLVLHGRFRVRPRTVAFLVASFGFLGIYALPFVKYPANPPAIGHEFTIQTRGYLYLTLVGTCLVLLGLAAFLAVRLRRRIGTPWAVTVAAVAFLAVYGVVIGLLPSPGNLSANVAHAGEFGYARSATETPQPITNILGTPLVVDGTTYAPGQIVFPGFDPDLLWTFRWYSLLSQLLVWTTIALVFGVLVDRFVLGRARARRTGTPAATEPVPAV